MARGDRTGRNENLLKAELSIDSNSRKIFHYRCVLAGAITL